MQPIRIGGAGIAGLTAAINLARADFEVVVFEKNKEVGAHHCGDFEGIENWTTEEDALNVLKQCGIDLTDNDLSPSFLLKPWHQVTAFDYRSERHDLISEKPLFYLIKRGPYEDCLDQYLKRMAERLGVKFEFNKPAKKDEVDIIAFGHSGRPFGLACGIIFRTDLKDSVMTILDDNLSPKAYSYFITVNGDATLATCLMQDFNQYKEYFDRTLEKFKNLLKCQIKEPRYFSGAVNVGILSRQTKIYIGEAAGFQDALWGFGMKYAILSGCLAARAIIENKDYWIEVKEKIHPLLKAGIANRFIWGRLGNKGYVRLLKRMTSIKNIRNAALRHYQFTIYRKILFPFAKFILRKKLIK